MSAHQRRKGRAGEIEVQKRLNDLLIGADAILNYGQPELVGASGDVHSTVGAFEVKRRASLPAWMELHDGVRGVYVRRDRGEWMVLVRAEDFEDLLMCRDRWLKESIVMTDHAKVLREMAVERTAEIAACAAGADAIEECERLRAENARLKELGRELRYLLACNDNPSGIATPGCDCDSCTAARAWDEKAG